MQFARVENLGTKPDKNPSQSLSPAPPGGNPGHRFSLHLSDDSFHSAEQVVCESDGDPIRHKVQSNM